MTSACEQAKVYSVNSKEQLKKEADELVKKVKQDAKEWDEAFSGKTKFTKEMDERFRRAAEYAMKERKKRHDADTSYVNNKPELKPCPFCGGDADVDENIYNSVRSNDWSVFCDSCRIKLTRKTKELAIEKWNTRHE